MQKKISGLSLIELVVSIMIACLLFFSVQQLFRAGFRYRLMSKSVSIISILLRRTIEKNREIVINTTTPLTNIRSAFFPFPNNEYRCKTDFYTYEIIKFPQTTGTEDETKRKYLVAIYTTAEGPVDEHGNCRMGYRIISMMSLVAANNYQGVDPIAPQLPVSLHPPQPNPMMPIYPPPLPPPPRPQPGPPIQNYPP